MADSQPRSSELENVDKDMEVKKEVAEAVEEPEKPLESKSKDFKAILRIADKEVKGETPIYHAIARAKGASFMFSNAVCHVLNLDSTKRAGEFSTKELDKIEECMKNPHKFNIPSWLVNRRRDLETGEDKHLISSDLDLAKEFDIRRLKKIRTYRGWRHSKNLRVRGQRTRTTGRTGKTLGVIRKKKK